MSKENKKKKWDKPMLTVLTRGKPEERVLGACKGSYAGGGGVGLNVCFIGCGICWIQTAS